MKVLFIVGLVAVSAFVAWRMVSRVSASEARDLVRAGARLVDVRTPSEFAAGHIDGATNIPVDALPKRANEIGAKHQPVVVYCQAGVRSARAKRILEEAGWTNVHDLGSMSRW